MKIVLKKCISLVMVIFIMSASFSVFAAEDATAPAETSALTEAQLEKYNRDLEFLKAVGIWTSPQTDPKLTVTRGEFASAVAGLCNLTTVTSADLKYSDVNADTLFVESINAAGVANLMVGSDGMFRPDDKITYIQAAKTVVCALGYEAIANSRGGYPDGYYSVAVSLGLTVGRGRDEAMTRRDVVELIRKACDIDVMNVVGVSEDRIQFEIVEEKNALAVYRDTYKLEGKFTDDGLTNIKGASQCAGSNVIIAGVQLHNDGVATDGLLGYNVIAYYNADEEKLLYLKADDEKNDVLVIKAEDIVTDSDKLTKTNIVYKSGRKTTDAKINPYADFVYNGSAYPAFLADDYKIKSGSLTLIDNNFDNVYDVIIAEEFVNYLLLANNQVNQMVSDSYGNDIYYGDYKKYEFFTPAGETKAISLLKSNSVLSVFASKDDTRVKIIVSDDKVDGKVTAIETDEDGKELVTITHSVEGQDVETAYEYSATFLENLKNKVSGYKKVSLNDELTLRLDFEGRIAGIEAYDDQYQYAYFLSAGKDNASKLASKCLIKLCLNTGDVAVISTAKKVIINGTSTENGGDILGVEDLYVNGDTSGDFRRQVVKVKISAIGELKEIETTNDSKICTNSYGFDPTRFCMVYMTAANTDSEYYNNKRQSYSGKYNMDENTTIFLVPNDDEFDENYIKVVEPAQLYDLARKATVRMYDANEFWTTKAVEVKSNKGTGFLPRAMSVIKSVKGVNSDGEDIYMVTGRYKDEEYTLREERPGVIDSVVSGGFKFGDIVEIKIDENNNIVDANLVVRTSEATPFKTVTGNEDTGEGVFYGHIYARNDKVVTLSTDRGASVRAHSIATGPQPVIIDYINHEVRQGSYTDIPVSASVDANGNFTYTDNGVMMYISRYSGYIRDAVVVIK